MPTTPKKRVLWLDLLRVTAIFAMVLLHVCTGNFLGLDSAWRTADPAGLSWQALNLFDCLTRFCVPVFCMISGVFFLDPEREIPFKKLFSKNIRRVALAFVGASALYALLGPVLRGETLSFSTLVSMVKNGILGHYHLWFLLMLIGFYLVVPLLRKICENRKSMEYFLLLAFVFTFLQNAALLVPGVSSLVAVQAGNMSVGLVTGFVGYFVLGSYLYRFPLKPVWQKWVCIGGGAALVLTVVTGGILSLVTGVAEDALYGYLLPNTLLEAMAVFLLFRQWFEKKEWSEKTTQVIETLSRYSFGVYLVHDLFNMLLHRLGVTALSFFPLLSVPVLTAAVLAASIGVTALLYRIPLLKKYIL